MQALKNDKPRIVFATTVPATLLFFEGLPELLEKQQWDTTFVTSPGPELHRFEMANSAKIEVVPMTRAITPGQDLLSLLRWTRLLSRIRPHIVIAGTPKASLLALSAARFLGIPSRIFHVRGLLHDSKGGLSRYLLLQLESLTARASTKLIAVSPSVARIARSSFGTRRNVIVLGKGSSHGVDTQRFHNGSKLTEDANRLRARLRIEKGARVIGFVGRITRDKGIVELGKAWTVLRSRHSDVHLVVVGALEDQRGQLEQTISTWNADIRCHIEGPVADTLPYYSLFDILVLPTYREGFPNVLLEAASMSLPVVATRVTGCIDAVRDGSTGTLVAPRDPAALADALNDYLENPKLRNEHGKNGRQFVEAHFDTRHVNKLLIDFLRTELGSFSD